MPAGLKQGHMHSGAGMLWGKCDLKVHVKDPKSVLSIDSSISMNGNSVHSVAWHYLWLLPFLHWIQQQKLFILSLKYILYWTTYYFQYIILAQVTTSSLVDYCNSHINSLSIPTFAPSSNPFKTRVSLCFSQSPKASCLIPSENPSL